MMGMGPLMMTNGHQRAADEENWASEGSGFVQLARRYHGQDSSEHTVVKANPLRYTQ